MARVRFPRPGRSGYISVRAELCLAWAPSTDRDPILFTDLMFAGTRITVAMPYEEVDKLLAEADPWTPPDEGDSDE